MAIQKLTPFLWYDNNAADAAAFYCKVFKNSRITNTNPMVTEFELEGMRILALNGGPMHKLTDAFSMMINCDTQEEIDYYWDTLTADGGQESMCGWLVDKYGLSWQVTPSEIGTLLSGDPEKAQRVMAEVMKMKKLDLKKMREA